MSASKSFTPETSANAATAKSMLSDRTLFFDQVHDRNIKNVQNLLNVTLPVSYGENLYADLCKSSRDFTFIAYYKDLFVGVIASKIEQYESSKQVHLLALSVLAPYRGMKIGSKMLQTLITNARENEEISRILLHVQKSNVEAIEFYKRHGFSIEKEVTNYYQRVSSGGADAVLMILKTKSE